MLSKRISRICQHRPLMRCIPQRKRQSPTCPTLSVAWCRNSCPDKRDAWKGKNSIGRISLTSVWSFKRHKKQGRHSEALRISDNGSYPSPMSDQPASTIPKPSAEKMQELNAPATTTTSKASEPVKTTVIKERPLSSGASDRKATQSTQPVHRQNVEKVVSQETRQNYTKDRTTKVQQTQSVRRTSRPQRKPVTL